MAGPSVDRLAAILTADDREYQPSMTRRKADNGRPLREHRCLTAFIEIGGVKALTLFDSGGSIDAMSPEFARVASLKTFELENPVPLQLGCVGSRSVINFGVKTRMTLGNRSEDVYFDFAMSLKAFVPHQRTLRDSDSGKKNPGAICTFHPYACRGDYWTRNALVTGTGDL